MAARKQLEDDFGEVDEEDDDDEAEEDEEEEEDGLARGADDDDDVLDGSNEYAELFAQKQRDLGMGTTNPAGGSSNGGEEEEEDDEYEDEEGVFGPEQLFETPLDKLDSYVVFSQVVQGLQPLHSELLRRATQGLDQTQQEALRGIVTKAQQGGEGLKATNGVS